MFCSRPACLSAEWTYNSSLCASRPSRVEAMHHAHHASSRRAKTRPWPHIVLRCLHKPAAHRDAYEPPELYKCFSTVRLHVVTSLSQRYPVMLPGVVVGCCP